MTTFFAEIPQSARTTGSAGSSRRDVSAKIAPISWHATVDSTCRTDDQPPTRPNRTLEIRGTPNNRVLISPRYQKTWRALSSARRVASGWQRSWSTRNERSAASAISWRAGRACVAKKRPISTTEPLSLARSCRAVAERAPASCRQELSRSDGGDESLVGCLPRRRAQADRCGSVLGNERWTGCSIGSTCAPSLLPLLHYFFGCIRSARMRPMSGPPRTPSLRQRPTTERSRAPIGK